MTALSDEELVARYRGSAGSPADRNSINELFERYQSRIATWCFRFTGDREDALDLAQGVFMKAYRHMDSFRGDSRFSTWLYSIARNHCINHMKSRPFEPADSSDAILSELPDPCTVDTGKDMDREESLRVMRRLMAENLDETENLVMKLHYAEELPLNSVTRLLGLTNASGAKAYVVSARRKLNTAIQRWRVKGQC